jgi:1-acyl-sn-glycerol-3-phosphate acyltransferase
LPLRRIDFIYSLFRSLGFLIFRIVYRVTIEGRENLPEEGPAMILPKHQFWTDIPLVGLALWRPASYIAKQELFMYPGIRQFITSLGGVPIDRLNPVKSLDSFRYVEQLLKNGDFIILYPEGTYCPHAMGRGKHRFIQRILNFQGKMKGDEKKSIPFIPVGMQYVGKRFRGEVKVKIGPALFARGETEALEFTKRVMEEIARLSGLHPREEKRQVQKPI